MPRSVEGKEAEEDRHCDGVCIRSDLERMGEEWRKRTTGRWKELETADKERSERKMRGKKKTMETEIMVNSPLTTGMPRKEKQQL